MEQVRAWIEEHARTTLLMYLITHPSASLGEPARQINTLINGSNLEYRYPLYPQQPVPATVSNLTDKFYPHQVVELVFIGVLIVLALWVDTRREGRHWPVWWVLLALAISVYPLILLVWNGNPLEVERHAAQIGIQYRLAGLIAIALLLDKIQSVSKLPASA